jgi:DNA-directed RNA polymerase specialized sigma24 family protein
MANRQGDLDLIGAVERLNSTSDVERRRADGFIYDFIRTDAKSDIALDTAEEIADDLTSKLSADERARRKVIEARGPVRCLQGMVLHSFCDMFRRRRTRVNTDTRPLIESHESSLEVMNRVWEIHEVADTVSALFDTLFEEERDLLRLRYVEGLTIRETAVRMKMRYSLVAQRLLVLQSKLLSMLVGCEA